MRNLLLIPLLLLVLAPATLAEDNPRLHWRSEKTRILEVLHDLADRCSRMKLFGTRADIYEQVLNLSPDDKTARKWLKYKRGGNGEWTRKRWTRPRNGGKGVEEIVSRRQELAAEYRPRLRQARDVLLDAALFKEAAEVVIAAVALDPEDEAFRAWNGEVREGEAARPGQSSTWILRESLDARVRRPLFKQTAQDAIKQMPAPTESAPHKNDRIGGVSWGTKLQGKRVRVVGTPDKEEMELLLRYAEATWPLFEAVFDIRPGSYQSGDSYATGLTIYSLDSIPIGNELLAKWPGYTDREREFLGPLVALWLKRAPAVLCKSPSPDVRLEAGPRQINQAMVTRALGLRTNRAWAKEGLSLYLTWQITGTRVIRSVKDVETDYGESDKPIPDYEKNLADPNADWLALGLELIKSKDKPDIHLLAGKKINDLTKFDVLYAYCISAYICEGHPKRSVDFYRRLAAEDGADIDAVCLESLGFDHAALEARVQRWLEETTNG
jgi:hypothetical protein